MKKDEKKNKNTSKEKNTKRKSKFNYKYSDRIASIKEADEMIKLKEEKMKKEKQLKKETKKSSVASKPKSARGRRRKSPQEIREDMLKNLDESKFK